MALVEYEIEEEFGSFKIIDETNEEREGPLHMFTTGMVKKWREFNTPKEDGPDLKTTFYELNLDYENIPKKDHKEVTDKYGDTINFSINTPFDRNLSSISSHTKKKHVDHKTQDLIRNIFMFISLLMNVFLIVQQSLDPSERFIIDITVANAGWVATFFAILWGIDASQSSKAVEATLFIQEWRDTYHTVYEETKPVAIVTMLESTESRVSDNIPIKMETEHILIHDHRAEIAEEKLRSLKRQLEQKDEIIKDLKKDKEENEKRINMVRKEYYRKGLIDSDAKVSLVAETSEIFTKYDVPLKYLAVGIIGFIIYAVLKSIAENTQAPRGTFIVSITDIPPIAWIMAGLVILFVFRWIMNYLGYNK